VVFQIRADERRRGTKEDVIVQTDIYKELLALSSREPFRPSSSGYDEETPRHQESAERVS